VLADFSQLSDLRDVEFAKWLTKDVGVAPVPGSSFFRAGDGGSKLVRFAFCKKHETLIAAGERLASLRSLV
jgi:aspartate/methionine/tyrosine aminotransferase